MSTSLIMNFHPNPEASRINAALLATLADLDGLKAVAMAQAAQADGNFDLDREIARMLDTDRLVLQFPLYWYAPPPLLAQWQAQVLTHLFYITPEVGARLAGKPLLVVATAGGNSEAYSPAGQNGFVLNDLLHPLHASANRTGLMWHEPHLVLRANEMDDAELAAEADSYRARIGNFVREERLVSA